jgi:hypothetical protein
VSRRLAPTPLSPATIARAQARKQRFTLAPPAPLANTRAVTHGAAADGANLPGFEQTRAEVQAAIDAASWLQPTDLLVLDVFCRELHAFRFTSDALARMSSTAYLKKTNAWKLQTRRARVLGELADRLGLTATSRVKLGLTAARAERTAQQVRPVRSEERALEVGAILAQAGALPGNFRVIEAPEPPAELPREEPSPASGELFALHPDRGERVSPASRSKAQTGRLPAHHRPEGARRVGR